MSALRPKLEAAADYHHYHIRHAGRMHYPPKEPYLKLYPYGPYRKRMTSFGGLGLFAVNCNLN
jgi:hypothetical protein